MRHIFIILFLMMVPSLYAQSSQAIGEDSTSLFNGVKYKIESGVTVGSGQHSPLWLNANKQGLSSINKDNGYVAAGIFKHMLATNFAYDYGLEFVGAYNFTSNVIVQQAYVDLRYHGLQLSIGSKERYGELVNQQLSSGGLSFSGNARPIPQIRVELLEYITVPYTNGWLGVRGHIAYGWFTDGNWQKSFVGANGDRTSGVLYHSKALFLKIEKPEVLPLRFECGLQMECQFGGTRYYSDGTKFSMPERLKDYLKALIPMHGGSGVTESDQENIEGNMLGNYHLSLNYNIKDWNIRPYYEHYFEDKSMMTLTMKHKWKDGLIGFEIIFPKNQIINNLVAEYFGSMDQSGPRYKVNGKYVNWGGDDDYYNNSFYQSWSHWGMAIGNPLFMSPIYNKDHSLSFHSNRMTARHIGISGNPTNELSYRVLLSYTRNWGTYDSPYKGENGNDIVITDTSTLFELTFSPHKLSGWSFVASAATDRGDMLGNNTGVMLTVRLKR